MPARDRRRQLLGRAIEEFLRSQVDDPVTARLDELADETNRATVRRPLAGSSTAAPGVVARGELWWVDFGDPDRRLLDRRIAALPAVELYDLDRGLRLVLGL